MAVTNRVQSVIYGSLTAPGTVGASRVEPVRAHSLDISYRTFRVDVVLLLTSPSVPDFAADCQTLEGLMRTPRQRLRVQWSSNNSLDLDPSQNTSLTPEGSFSKPGSAADTALSRVYVLTVSGGRQADLSGQNGLRDFRWTLSDTQDRQQIVLTGEYTPVGSGTQARQQYLDSIEARFTTITNTVGGTWELQEDRHEPDDTDQTVRFQRTYTRLTFNQASGTLDHASIRRQQFSVNKRRRSLSSRRGTPLVELELTYQAAITRSEVDDGNGEVQVSNVLSLYEDTIRPYLREQLDAVADGGTVAAVVEDPQLSFDPPAIGVTIRALTQDAGASTLIRKTVQVTDIVRPGGVLTEFWPGRNDPGRAAQNSSRASRAVENQGPRLSLRIYEVTSTFLRGPRTAALGEAQNRAPFPEARGRVMVEEWISRTEDRIEGTANDDQIEVTDVIDVARYRLYTPIGADDEQVSTSRERNVPPGLAS